MGRPIALWRAKAGATNLHTLRTTQRFTCMEGLEEDVILDLFGKICLICLSLKRVNCVSFDTAFFHHVQEHEAAFLKEVLHPRPDVHKITYVTRFPPELLLLHRHHPASLLRSTTVTTPPLLITSHQVWRRDEIPSKMCRLRDPDGAGAASLVTFSLPR